MTTYTAYDDQDPTNHWAGRTLEQALAECIDKAAPWAVMTDEDYAVLMTGAEFEARIGADGVTCITRIIK
jgi:hypothetical protein